MNLNFERSFRVYEKFIRAPLFPIPSPTSAKVPISVAAVEYLDISPVDAP